MRSSRVIIGVAIAFTLAACGSDQTSKTPSEPSFSKGVSSPGTVVSLQATYDTFVPTYYSDERAVAGAPAVVTPFSLGGPRPAFPPLDESKCLWFAFDGSGTYDITYCINAVDRPITYTGRCTAWQVQGGTRFEGVLRATGTAAPTTTLSYGIVRFDKITRAVIDFSSAEHVGFFDAPSAVRRATLDVLDERYRLQGGFTGFLARNKTTTDIPGPIGLGDNLAIIASHIGNGDALTDPSALLALLGSQSLVDLALTVSPVPVFNPAVHANHPACRGPDQAISVNIPFSETANVISTPSGNQNLIFAAGLSDPALHYNAQQATTRGEGSLVSDDGQWLIDLSQFTGSSLPIIDNLMNGSGVRARACTKATPAKCNDVALERK